MKYWLMKSEPSTFSIDDLMAKKQPEIWEGVRNFQARNFLKQMQPGDTAFFYHSSCQDKGIVGRMEIVKSGLVDETAFNQDSPYYDPLSTAKNPRWYTVSVRGLEKFKEVIHLAQLKADPKLKNFILLKPGNRLSVMPMTVLEWKRVLELKKELKP